jgi:hypothetical protein
MMCFFIVSCLILNSSVGREFRVSGGTSEPGNFSVTFRKRSLDEFLLVALNGPVASIGMSSLRFRRGGTSIGKSSAGRTVRNEMLPKQWQSANRGS